MRKGKITMLAAAFVAAVALAGPASAAEVLAYWSFNPGNADLFHWSADYGSGSLTVQSGWGGDLSTTGGTAVNAMPTYPAGNALNFKSSNHNGSSMDFLVDTTGWEGVIFSFAVMRSSSGFGNNADSTVSWSTDGVNYTVFSAYTTTTGWSTVTLDMSSVTALDDAASVYLRITLNGASNNGGTGQLDNVRVGASLIPAPGVLAMLGVAGLAVRRRRRRA